MSNVGRIMSLRAGKRRLMKPQTGTPYGHLKVVIGVTRKSLWIHRAVLLAFIGEPEPGQIARHLDGDPTNNHLGNLAWGTPAENNADMSRHGTSTRGERGSNAKLNEDQVRAIRALRGVHTAAQVAGMYVVSETCIRSIWTERTWSHIA